MERDWALDLVEIGALLDAFVVGMDRMFGPFPIRLDLAAADGVIDLFAPDGVLHTPFSRSEGREAIRESWERVAGFDTPADGPKYVQHHLTSREITRVDATTAYTTVYVQGLTDVGLDHWGLYEDRLVKLSEGWKLAERLVSVTGCVPGGYYANLPNPRNPIRTW
ncbi:MAG: nuclear transport factor 2 family protein [Mycobacteriaceae bacterium]